ncbi:MAG: porin [Planctomycetes bacterium]|nr:porin [Planctomycetota bacterium]
MRNRLLVLLSGLCLAASAARAEEAAPAESVEQRLARLEQLVTQSPAKEAAGRPTDFHFYWKDGLRLDTLDGAFKLKIGGRIQLDTAFYEVRSDLKNAVADSQDGIEFRRARIEISGDLYKYFEFKLQYDFAARNANVTEGGVVGFKDVFMGVTDLPYAWAPNVRVGHFKEPFSLEELTSSNDISFMERSLANVFAPARNAGAMAHKTAFDDRMLWAVGIFRETDDRGFDAGDGQYNATGRITALPLWMMEDAYQLLHLGVAYSYRNPNGDERRYRQRPESHLAQRYVDTGTFGVREEHRIGLEAALVIDSLSLQAEYMHSECNATGGLTDMDFDGFYVMASYIVTGEHRPYDQAAGIFKRVKPSSNVFDGGTGAIELVARYSYLDLGGKSGVDGGTIHDVTAGTGWYLNPNYKVIAEYIFSHLEGVDDLHAVQLRFQLAF